MKKLGIALAITALMTLVAAGCGEKTEPAAQVTPPTEGGKPTGADGKAAGGAVPDFSLDR